MNTRENIINQLERRHGDFISGEEIAASLGISRAAVWKVIRKLIDEGYAIEAVRNSGYRLAVECKKRHISAERIQQYLEVPLNIRVYSEVNSTNIIAREAAIDTTSELLIIASSQTAGRGRYGRSFFSPAGSGLYMSFLLHPSCEAVDSVLITTSAAVAVARAVDSLRCELGVMDDPSKIKWVNDIYLHERKVCGILTEAQLNLETAKLDYAILGIGLNVLEPEGGFPDEISSRAGFIFNSDAPDDIFDRLTAKIANEFFRIYPVLDKSSFIEEYRSRCFIIGREVTVWKGELSYQAVVKGIDDDLRLIVCKDSGETEALGSGEVTLKL
jgi:BirA family biotin operon repressor/biotin-[acetyl-CoA-carboxylase] ligase